MRSFQSSESDCGCPDRGFQKVGTWGMESVPSLQERIYGALEKICIKDTYKNGQ